MDRLEICSLVCTSFEILGIEIESRSLLEGDRSVMGETFRPGNTALFNRERLCRRDVEIPEPRLTVRIRNLRPTAFVFSSTLYGDSGAAT